jgi:hypothetical protein
MGNRNRFTSVLESLRQAEQLLNIGIERGNLSSIERDILLEKLRASYEQLLFDKEPAQPMQKEIVTEVEQKKGEPVNEPVTHNLEPEVITTPEPKSISIPTTAPSIQEKVPVNIIIEKVEEVQKVVIEREEVTKSEKETIELVIESTNSFAEDSYIRIEERSIEEDKVTTSTLAEKYQGKKKFRNEMLGNGKKDVASLLQNKPIGDLTRAIGINDKFLFTKELFNGNAELYARSIKQLNEYTDINDALIYIQENFNWDDKNEAANQLIDLVRRKLLIG